jgi:hypothetical protein
MAMLEKALLINDISRRELTNVEAKESKTSLQTQITDMGMEVSCKAYELTRDNAYFMKAFAFMEKSKANILLDQVYEVRARQFSGIPDNMLERELRLKGELSLSKDRLLKTSNSADNYNDTKIHYDEKMRDYMSLISEMEKVSLVL